MFDFDEEFDDEEYDESDGYDVETCNNKFCPICYPVEVYD